MNIVVGSNVLPEKWDFFSKKKAIFGNSLEINIFVPIWSWKKYLGLSAHRNLLISGVFRGNGVIEGIKNYQTLSGVVIKVNNYLRYS